MSAAAIVWGVIVVIIIVVVFFVWWYYFRDNAGADCKIDSDCVGAAKTCCILGPGIGTCANTTAGQTCASVGPQVCTTTPDCNDPNLQCCPNGRCVPVGQKCPLPPPPPSPCKSNNDCRAPTSTCCSNGLCIDSSKQSCAGFQVCTTTADCKSSTLKCCPPGLCTLTNQACPAPTPQSTSFFRRTTSQSPMANFRANLEQFQ